MCHVLKREDRKTKLLPQNRLSSISDTKQYVLLTTNCSGRIIVEFQPNVNSSGCRQSSRKKKLNSGYLQD